MEWHVPLADLDYGVEEEQAVLGVLRSRWLTMGGVTKEFEAQFARQTGSRHAIAVSNATQALHLACLALGIGPGDEVIVPSLTFVATANAVLYTGAEVRFADIIGPDELTVDPDSIEAAITPRTKAIIVMHYAGYPCRMREISALAEKHGLAVIEDAAHAPGASLDGRALGAWGALGCFSFFSNKNLSTGEGGMVTTDDDALAERVRLMRSHGMTSLTYDRHKGHAFSYDVVALGYNDRIDEMRAALGVVQLSKLAGNNARRADLTRLYWQELAGTGLELPFSATMQGRSHTEIALGRPHAEIALGKPSHHIFPMLLPPGLDRLRFMEALRDAGIQSSIHYRPMHTFSYYRERYGEQHLPRTEDVAAREVTLPLYPTMGEDKVKVVVEAVRSALLAQHSTGTTN
jgi:dTDP-4-amino-4,6-dideoxygalactose transaminase